MIERVPVEQGDWRFRFTHEADEMLAEEVDHQIEVSSEDDTSEEIFQAVIFLLILRIFSWTEIVGPVPLPEETLAEYYEAFRLFQGDKWQGRIELIGRLRREID